MARKDFWILRGVVVVRGSSGITGSPLKVVEALVVVVIMRVVFVALFKTGRMCFDSCVKRESIYSLLYIPIAIAAMAKRMEKKVFIDCCGGYLYLQRGWRRESSREELEICRGRGAMMEAFLLV